MDYDFEAILALTPQQLKNYGRFHATYVQRWRVLWSSVLAVLMLAIGGLLLTAGSKRELSPLILIVAGLLLPVTLWWQASGRTTVKRNSNNLGLRELRYRFYDDRMEYADQQNQGFYYYGQIYAAYETREYFFIYLAKNQACFLRKDGFTRGGADGLREFLWTRLGEKFKVTNWK